MTATRVLVVDDEPSIRTTVSLLLSLEGYEVEGAADGRAGLHSALERPPAIILTDVHMPHMDGHALLAAVRGSASLVGTRVVLLAVPPDRSAVSAPTGLAPDAWLSKPFTRVQLLDVLRALHTA